MRMPPSAKGRWNLGSGTVFHRLSALTGPNLSIILKRVPRLESSRALLFGTQEGKARIVTSH